MLDVSEVSLACLGLKHYVMLLPPDFVLEFLRWCPVIFGDRDALSILVLDMIVLVMSLLGPIKTSKAPADHVAHFLDDVVIALLYFPLTIDVVRC